MHNERAIFVVPCDFSTEVFWRYDCAKMCLLGWNNHIIPLSRIIVWLLNYLDVIVWVRYLKCNLYIKIWVTFTWYQLVAYNFPKICVTLQRSVYYNLF